MPCEKKYDTFLVTCDVLLGDEDLEERGISGWFKLEKAPILIATGTVVILMMSVAHDVGFFSIVGSEFQELMSPSDYISGAIYWSPAFTVATVLTGLILLSFGRYRGFTTRRIPRRRLRTLSPVLLSIVAIVLYIIAILVVFVHYDWTNILVAPLILIDLPWLIIWGVILSHETPRGFIGNFGILIILVSVPFILILFGIGRIDAKETLISTGPVFSIETAKEPIKHVIVIRNIDRGIIYRDPIANKITFVKWTDVLSFSRVAVRIDERSYSCVWFGLNCPFVPGPP